MLILRICSRRQDCWGQNGWWLQKVGGSSILLIFRKNADSANPALLLKESILVFLIHSRIRLCSSWQYLTNFSKKCGLSEFFLGGRTVGGKMGGGDKNQMVSCIVAKESILLILIHSLIRLCTAQLYLINFSKKCGLCEFVLEGRTVGGKMGGGYGKQVVSCIVAEESILVFLIHSLIRLCSSWQYLINFSKKC